MSLRDSKRIVAAAIWYKGITYCLPPPARHHDIIKFILAQTSEESIGEHSQGFLDDNYKFLRRKPAKIVAERAGQILNNDAPKLDELYSENLW